MMCFLIYQRGYIVNYKTSIGSTDIADNKDVDNCNTLSNAYMTGNNDVKIQESDSKG